MAARRRHQPRARSHEPHAGQEPPDDFRLLSVCPTSHDILSMQKPFLRRNVTRGPYDGVDHYLDVQFRLLREDFVRPLREGIAACRDPSEAGEDKTTLRLCHDVTFNGVAFFNDALCVRVVLCPKQDNFNDNDKAFMFGSLVLFTRDGFDTMIRATVMDSQSGAGNKRNLKVKLIDDVDLFDISFHESYTLAESVAFFEPYLRVLTALQTMTLETYPLCRYITGQANKTQPPAYASNTSCTRVSPARDCLSADQLGLNATQFEAYKGALSREFAIIQGPPGTGKTYLGAKVVQALVDDADNTTDDASPLLVVCATNHALDQFLENFLKFTHKLVRVGNQSNSDLLAPYLLSAQRKHSRHVNSRLAAKVREISSRMTKLYKKIRGLIDARGLLIGCRGIISLGSLFPIMGYSPADFSDGILDATRLLEWLEVDSKGLGDLSTIDKGSSTVVLAIDFNTINAKLNDLDGNIQKLQDKKGNRRTSELQIRKLEADHSKMRHLLASITTQHTKKQAIKHNTAVTLLKLPAWNAPLHSRWHCYHYWASLAASELRRQALVALEEFNIEAVKLKQCRQDMDLNVLRGAQVVGMTTSGAARLRPLLDQLKPRTVIVEEAAEVLEGHIVASLTRHCQHVILIGDHQQLRPITSSHALTRDYQLDVSLFERMLNNRVPCVTLNVQHRMRPEVARLVSPVIYPRLMNHVTVLNRDNVRGVHKSVFFITHDKPEQVSSGKSQSNLHEVRLLVALCRYLLLQEYDVTKITIIAMYGAQVACLEAERNKFVELQQVKISTVDGYQGEENDIVLLSLVRSNPSAKIGFLRTINRVCVALSRAKNGLYIVGNMENLTRQKGKSLWCRINAVLQHHGSIGSHLHLQCKHHGNTVRVNTAEQFDFDHLDKTKCPLNCRVESLITSRPLQVMDLNDLTSLHGGKSNKLAKKEVTINNENSPPLISVVESETATALATLKRKEDPHILNNQQPTIVNPSYYQLLQEMSRNDSDSYSALEDILKAKPSAVVSPIISTERRDQSLQQVSGPKGLSREVSLVCIVEDPRFDEEPVKKEAAAERQQVDTTPAPRTCPQVGQAAAFEARVRAQVMAECEARRRRQQQAQARQEQQANARMQEQINAYKLREVSLGWNSSVQYGYDVQSETLHQTRRQLEEEEKKKKKKDCVIL